MLLQQLVTAQTTHSVVLVDKHLAAHATSECFVGSASQWQAVFPYVMEYIDVYDAYKWKIIWLLLPYCPLANSSGPTSKRQIKQASQLLDCSQTVAPVIKSSTQWTPADGCFVSQDKGTSQCTTPSYVKETSKSLFVSNPVRNLPPEKGLTAMDAMGERLDSFHCHDPVGMVKSGGQW